METILSEWEAFAATRLPAAAKMDALALRNHARQILQAVAKDLETHESPEQQVAKSRGLEPKESSGLDTAPQTHAVLRAKAGFDINQMAAEYRALRAGVLRLWSDAIGWQNINVGDLIRFNEAIDQALGESIKAFTTNVERSRNLLLGMIAHDIRSPLQTIQADSSYLLTVVNLSASVLVVANRLMRCSARIKALLDDVVLFNRSTLGLEMNIHPSMINLGSLFAGEIEQLRAAHPGRTINLEESGDLRGSWDSFRLQQVLANLVSNALRYGSQDTPVHVKLTGNDRDVRFDVVNTGPSIAQLTLDSLFDPLRRGVGPELPHPHENLGLGLFIARQIAKSHGGDIQAKSSNGQTVFSVVLPRAASQE